MSGSESETDLELPPGADFAGLGLAQPTHHLAIAAVAHRRLLQSVLALPA